MSETGKVVSDEGRAWVNGDLDADSYFDAAFGKARETGTKHGMGHAYRHASWKACWCQHCRPRRDRGFFRRHLHKLARIEGKREIRDSL